MYINNKEFKYGFCKDVVTMLPMEFATEADKLLSLKLEGTIG